MITTLNCSSCKALRPHNSAEGRYDHWTCTRCGNERHYGGAVTQCQFCPLDYKQAVFKEMRSMAGDRHSARQSAAGEAWSNR